MQDKIQVGPLISIIVPIYNSELTIERCLKSILHQTYTNFELILVNDGSTDSSEKKMKILCEDDRRIKLYKKKNGGVSSARNFGLEHASGEWIAFIDSDDYVTYDWLDNFLNLIEPNIDLVAQGFYADRPLYTKDEDESKSLRYGFRYSGKVDGGLERMHELGLVGFLWTKMFRKSIIDEYGFRFNEELSFKEDEEFVLRYFEVISQTRYTEKAGYFYQVPDWESKYIDVSYQVYEQLWSSVNSIYGNKDLPIVYDYMHSYIHRFLWSTKIPSIKEVLRVKRLLGRRLLQTNYPIILKGLWYADPTGCFFYILLGLYRNMKNRP